MRAYQETGNPQKALEIARKFEPQAGEATESLSQGIAFMACGEPDAARKAWKEGAAQTEAELKLEDQFGKRIGLALLYARLGQAPKARENVRRALSLAPGHPWTLSSRVRWRLCWETIPALSTTSAKQSRETGSSSNTS